MLGVEMSDDLESRVCEQVEKATSEGLGQVVGSAIKPFAKIFAEMSEYLINITKDSLRKRRGELLTNDSNTKVLRRIAEKIKSNPDKATLLEYVNKVYEQGVETNIENEEMFCLWSSLFDRIEQENEDVEQLISILKGLSVSEAKYLVEFMDRDNRYVIIDPVLQALRVSKKVTEKEAKKRQLASSLRKKEIIEQPFPLGRVVIIILLNIVALLLTAEILREPLKRIGINVSSANLVILLVAISVFMGVLSLNISKFAARLTWVGKILHEGAKYVQNNRNR